MPTAASQHHISPNTKRNPNPSPTGFGFGFLLFGAGDRGRTCMLLALDPKSSASANSATPAYITVALSSNGGIIAQIISFVNT